MHLKQDALADNSDPNAEAPRVFRGMNQTIVYESFIYAVCFN